MIKKIIYSSIFAVVFLSGCGGDAGGNDTKTNEPSNQNGEATNKAPIANAGADRTVTVNQTITIIGIATDSDGSIVSYEWKKGNNILGASATLNYTPINVGTDVLTFTVVDDDNNIDTDDIKLLVNEDDSSEDTGGATITEN